MIRATIYKIGLFQAQGVPMPVNASRRNFLKATSAATAIAGTLASAPKVHAAGDDVLKVGLVGCGGRGCGAAVNAIKADPNVQLWAMGDAFSDRLELAKPICKDSCGEKYAVSDDRCFFGFDAYQKVIDSGVDMVILATPPHFRPEHFEAVINAGKHCFIEKPVGVDVPGVKRIQAACKVAEEKGLAVVSGLCWRYHPGVVETVKRVKEGAIGDIIAIQSTYNAGLLWHRGDKPDWSRMEYQMRNWLYHTWLSGDHIAEQAVHSLDKTAWLNDDASPVSVYGMGGRQQRIEEQFGNIYDHHALTYEYENGVKVFFTCRQQKGCMNLVDEHVLGTKGSAWILRNEIDSGDEKWKYTEKTGSMYDLEHVALFKSIRDGKPINNGHYMCNSTLLAIMGRMATYSGKKITWEELMKSETVLGPTEYAWGDVQTRPVPIPGITEIS